MRGNPSAASLQVLELGSVPGRAAAALLAVSCGSAGLAAARSHGVRGAAAARGLQRCRVT